MARFLTLAYGVVCYLCGIAAILYAICFIGGFSPRSIDAGGPPTAPLTALIINVVLLGVFAVQHSGMARRGFKAAWTSVIPPAVERSTYVLFSALALGLLYWQWRPIAGTLWATSGLLATILWIVYWLGWAILFTSTFLINHFDLFGLAQVWAAWRGSKLPSPEFRTPLFYRVVRHPIYVGFILILWGAPTMTWGRALFAAGATGYILIGIWLEERDLIAVFGQTYRDYRARVSMLIPMPPKSGS
jgi:protein-S-isoprenylcysteine O-methyltransferase Ste14